MANNTSCGCMGTLKCVSGPLHHCPPPPPNPDWYEDFPYYGGPCPPCRCSGCGCKNKCRKCCCDCRRPSFDCPQTRCSAAMFSADAPLSTEAGEGVTLSAKICNGDYFACDDGCVRILRPGVYHLTWTANIPAALPAGTRFALSLNGREIAGSAQTLCAQSASTSASLAGQAIVSSPPDALLCLAASNALSVDCSADNVFTLSIVKLQ